jgi:hypothetical protein
MRAVLVARVPLDAVLLRASRSFHSQGEEGFSKADQEYKEAEVERQKAQADRMKRDEQRFNDEEKAMEKEEKELLAKKQARAHTGRAISLPRTWLPRAHPSVSPCHALTTRRSTHDSGHMHLFCGMPLTRALCIRAARLRALQALKDKKAASLAKAEEKEDDRKELASMLDNSEVRSRNFHKSINNDQTSKLTSKVPHARSRRVNARFCPLTRRRDTM